MSQAEGAVTDDIKEWIEMLWMQCAPRSISEARVEGLDMHGVWKLAVGSAT